MKKSISKNSVFYSIYNLLNVLFPFMSGIYAAHVLLPETIGEVTYAGNIAQYFVIMAFLGIPTYGLREISRARRNKLELNRVYSELFLINLLSTIFFLSVYICLIAVVPYFRKNIYLYIVAGLSIALNSINISWLYEGLEEFKFISIRNSIFKAFAFCLLIMLVKEPKDYLIYASLSAIGVCGNYVINMIWSHKFVTLTFHNLNLKRHLKSIFLLVVVNVAIEIYSLVDTTMLGLFCSKEHVTYYYYGHKINIILLTLLNTFTVVLVPRLSSCYEDNKEEFNRLLTKGLKIIFIFSWPMICGLQFVSDYILSTIYGESYINSSYVLRVLIFLLTISPIGYLLGSRVLLVAKQEKKMVICVSFGAIVNIIGNYFLIQMFQEIGAAFASLISEIVIMIIYILYGKKHYNLGALFPCVRKVFVSVCIMCIFLIGISVVVKDGLLKVTYQIMGGMTLYLLFMILQKEEITCEYFNRAMLLARKNIR